MGGNRSHDPSGNPAPAQLSYAKSLLIGAAGALAFLIGDPRKPDKEDEPFGESQSRQENIQTQFKRAEEPGRGRRAVSPTEIPWKGWKDIFWRTVNQASEDRLLAISAGVVFYGLLALFPAVTALVSCYGLFAKPDSINDHLSFLAGVMPAEAYSIVQDQIARVVAKGPTQRREDGLANRHEQLTLELAMLSEQKTAKIISLLEELRPFTIGLTRRLQRCRRQWTRGQFSKP